MPITQSSKTRLKESHQFLKSFKNSLALAFVRGMFEYSYSEAILFNHSNTQLPEQEIREKTKKELEYEVHKALFTNPYELIKIFKAVFKEGYKKHLKEIGYFSISELEDYLKKIDLS